MTTKVEPTVDKCQCKEGPSEGYCDACNKTAYITEPAHSLISKIPSAYGVGSANLSEQDKWESDFDKAFEGTMCDGTGVDYGDTQREVKDFIRTLLSHSVQEAKAEERQVMITKLHNIRSKIHGYISLTELTDLLASLKQEEEHE